MADPDLYAVFGHPIRHSQSPTIHRLFADQTGQMLQYVARDVPAENFEANLRDYVSRGGRGLNCTIPLKELAYGMADETSERATHCGAVNTLVVRKDGSLFGDNTDGIGLVRDLQQNLGIPLHGLDILLLGAGGAGRGILGPILACRPGHVFVANRTATRALDLVRQFDRQSKLAGGALEQLGGRCFDLVLNATAASLSNDLPVLPDGILKPGGFCYDLAYASQPTAFVRWGKMQGASVSVDGIGMLVEQAAEAFRLWRGVLPQTASVIDHLNQARSG